MEKIKTLFNKKQRILFLVNAAFLLAYALLTIAAHRQTEVLYSQQAANRWENGNMSYAQVSAFISPGKNTGIEEIASVRSSIASKLMKDSYNESKSGGRVWIDGYCGEVRTELRKDANTLNVTAVGVGGDFFQFHPMQLCSGGYIADSDLNRDRIVIDENLAWAMFGSNDVIGMQLWLNDMVYTVAGVVKAPEDGLEQEVYGDSNRVYMSYEQLKQHEETLTISCYEAVLPNPISNYAYYAVREAFGIADDDEESTQKKSALNFDQVEVIENTNRFETLPLLTKLKQWKTRSMRTSAVGYPFWENIARWVEEKEMAYLVFRGLVLIFPILCLIKGIWSLWKNRKWRWKDLFLNTLETIREKRERAHDEVSENVSEENLEELQSVTDEDIFRI